MGHKKEEVAWDRKQLHNEEFHYLYFSPNIIRVIKSRRWEGHVEITMEGTEGGKKGGRGVYRILVRKPKGKRPLGRR